VISSLIELTMPQMGVSVAEGTIVSWRKRPGDWIERDEVVVEISTDKVETEVPSPAAGRIVEILVKEGATVDVGTVLATLDTEARPGQPHADEQEAASAPAEAPSAPAEAAHQPAVSPVVRRIAAEHGIDLAQVHGSGRRGRVTKKDVLAMIEDGAGEGGRAGDAPAPEEPERPVEHESRPVAEPEPVAEAPGRPLSVMRRQIGEHMLRSLRTSAHCTTVVEVDMSAVEAARGRLSPLPFVARAVIGALRRYPTLNATLEDDLLTVHRDVHLGVAVSLGEDGLIVPVVRDAHELSHEGLARRIADLAERARSKRLLPEEVAGGTFTITNPGRFGALLATPIINQPQVAILDLEAVTKRPVVVTDQHGRDSIAVRPMAYLCLSWDHRALDGALAAQFLSAVRLNLEDWHG
jgi:2-oxoglutarate dehydrogenase E2 component (dihydrolipoamide succinyltransferase)